MNLHKQNSNWNFLDLTLVFMKIESRVINNEQIRVHLIRSSKAH